MSEPLQLRWEKQTGKYQSGEWARVGRIIVGSASYDGMGSKTDPNRYMCDCLLPGFKRSVDRYATLDEAKARLERMVRAWFSWTAQEPAPKETE